jgi:soluble lytic murein transglycosylase-like protein
MTLIRPSTPPASRHRCRRRSDSGPALPIILAGFLTVALMATAASKPWMPSAPASADVTVAAHAPTPAIAVPAAASEAASRAEKLASLVARRYRVAEAAASEMVHAAIREGHRHELDPVLILAVIAVESRFNPVAASDQGALGLMQVVPRFHMDKIAAIGTDAILLPAANIAIGTRILKDSIRRGGSDAAGLQLYNGAFEDETRAYANRVLSERRRLEEALPRTRGRA